MAFRTSRGGSPFLAAVLLCLPVAVWAFTGLNASDGWRGLAVISLLIPATLPIPLCVLHAVAHALVRSRRSRQE
jgi:hypothetical protein